MASVNLAFAKKIVTLLGPTGSGKDTQADLLSSKFGYDVIKIGRIIRRLAETNTKIAQEIQNGQLADNNIVNKIIIDKITTSIPSDGIILDGYPRHISQAKWLDRELAKNRQKLSWAILIDISDEVVKKRLEKRHRSDDTPTNIAKRLAIFHNQTAEVINYYRQSDRLKVVDGNKSIDHVAHDLEQAIEWLPK